MFNLLSWIRRYRARRYMEGLLLRGLKIGRHTDIYDGCCFDPDHCFLISIGNRCTIAPNVRIIAHDASMNDYVGITKVGLVTIHDDCFIGDSAIILPGVTIGPRVIVGAGAVITKSIPPDSVVAGNPARIIGSCRAFLEKHAAASQGRPLYPYEQYKIEVISEEDKRAMLQGLLGQYGYVMSRSKAHLK